MSVYLAVDLGTTGCRTIIFDDNLKELAISYEEYGLITPKEDWVEQDANLWWEMTLRTAKSAIAKSGINSREIKAISVSSQGITIVPVDKDLTPLCNALSWLDSRAKEQTARIEKDIGSNEIFEHTGKTLSPCYTLPKLLWLMENRQDICSKTWKYLMPLEYLTGKLTGNCITDHSMVSGTLMYDIKNCCWSRKILDLYNISDSQLPGIARSGESAGLVLPGVAKELGLSRDCIVAVGAQDQKCAACGVGLDDGVMTISLGTAAAITKIHTEARTYENKGVGWCGYVTEGKWVTEGVINTAGTSLRWIRDIMFPEHDYELINTEAALALERGSSLMFYPYLNGPSSPDFYKDCEGSFYGLNLSCQRGDFALAVMEGIAFQIRIILETMEAYGNVHSLVLFGGGANSSLWCSIIADVTGMNIKVPDNSEAAGAGAAILASMAAGKQINPLGFAREYTPGNFRVDYEEKYKKYRTIEKKLWTKEE